MEVERENIFAVHSMLHLIFHRNKNQHANSKWWKWLSILKRTTLKLGKSLRYESSRTKTVTSTEVYKRYLATQVVPECYLAFSTVVADGQFSTLGMVLLATLAHLLKAAGIERKLSRASRVRKLGGVLPHEMKLSKNEDVGEVLKRDPDLLQGSSSAQMQYSPTEDTSSRGFSLEGQRTATNADDRKSKKKSRKRKDAIDDLFDGLL